MDVETIASAKRRVGKSDVDGAPLQGVQLIVGGKLEQLGLSARQHPPQQRQTMWKRVVEGR